MLDVSGSCRSYCYCENFSSFVEAVKSLPLSLQVQFKVSFRDVLSIIITNLFLCSNLTFAINFYNYKKRIINVKYIKYVIY